MVGEQPVIEPGQSYSYVSGCHLHTDIGAMHGIYQMKRLIDGKIFDAKIPRFTLVAPFKLT